MTRTLVKQISTSPIISREYLIDQGVLRAVTSYTYSSDDSLDIITHFILDGNPIGFMRSEYAPSELFRESAFFHDIEVHFGYRLSRSDRLLVISELRLDKDVVFSGCAEFIVPFSFNFLFDAGFCSDRCVYTNLKLGMGEHWNDDVETEHRRIIDTCDNLISVTGIISIYRRRRQYYAKVHTIQRQSEGRHCQIH